ncbi:hypothetical protein [Pinirhizobacter sp.]|uniref:hypothetical protein n=1 Tax=Pinirhizobacter sp. TaxID=2950432 RepID=UPI002F3FD283
MSKYTVRWIELAIIDPDGNIDANRVEYVAFRRIGKISIEQDADGDYVIFFWADGIRYLLLSCPDHEKAQQEVVQLMHRIDISRVSD